MDNGIASYQDLLVWQEAMNLAEACYRLTRAFPKEEMYAMTSQIRRSAASVAANIAEGRGRDGTASFVQFLRVAQGSLKELETHLILSARVSLTAQSNVTALLVQCETVGKMLRGLIRSLQRKAARNV